VNPRKSQQKSAFFYGQTPDPRAQKSEDERDQSRFAKDVAQKQCAEAEEVRSSPFFFLGKVGDMGLSENRVYSQL
jgi:hypothetical protein